MDVVGDLGPRPLGCLRLGSQVTQHPLGPLDLVGQAVQYQRWRWFRHRLRLPAVVLGGVLPSGTAAVDQSASSPQRGDQPCLRPLVSR